MGIKVEFNPDLALRNIEEFKNGKRKKEECIPENIEKGKEYEFLKKGQRNYCLTCFSHLCETKGNEKISGSLAEVMITKYTNFINGEGIFTKGIFKVLRVLK
jgi:hypothetical protein